MRSSTPAATVHANEPMRRPVSLLAMPAARSPPAPTRSPRLPKIIGRVLPCARSQAVLLAVEDPVVTLDDDGVAARPRLVGERARPLHDVAEPGVEGTEVLGGGGEAFTGEVVLDAG